MTAAAPKTVKLLDCTLRDGGYANGFQFTARDTRLLTQGLAEAGIQWIEVGHGMGLGASCIKNGIAFEDDLTYIEAAKAAGGGAVRIGAFHIPALVGVDPLAPARAAGLDFVRIGSEIADFRATFPAIERARALGLEVHLNLMKTYAAPAEDVAALARDVAGLGLASLYVVDSAGCMLPDQVSAYVRAITDNSDVPAGFHGHNNLDIANANCLAALAAGATWIDATLRGMGRSSGNAQTEVLAALLPKAGYDVEVDPFVLFTLIERHLEPLMVARQGQPAIDVVIGMSRFHSGFLPRFRRVLDRYDVDLRRLIVEVSKVDCVNPSETLIETVARDLSRTDA